MNNPNFPLPQLKINRQQTIMNDNAQIDMFEFDLFGDNEYMFMTVHQNEGGQKYFCFHTRFEMFGWTDDHRIAFQAKNNAGIYTRQEFNDIVTAR